MPRRKELNILIVSDDKARRTGILMSIAKGSENLGLEINILDLAGSERAIDKMELNEPNIVLCDAEVSDWESLRKKFKKRRMGESRKKIFLLFYENASVCPDPHSEEMKEVDGIFCVKSIREKSNRVCALLVQKLAE